MSESRLALLGQSFSCECGRTHCVPLKKIVLESGALAQTSSVLKELAIQGRLFLLADETTWEVAGRRLGVMLSSAGFGVEAHVLPGKPRADGVTADAVAAQCPADADAVVTCGSGTITDLGKWAAFKRGIPQIAVATAPSMNGYASGIVALMRGGLKTTEAVRPPVAVIADIDILKNAPLDMIRAGLGDLLSKPVCNADWKLSSIIRGEHFCERPFELIRDLEPLYAGNSALLAKRDPSAIAALAEALVFSGVSMVIAGSSAPASGGEHLISHFLDMRAEMEGRDHDLHGAQVGVASVATASLYERLCGISADKLNHAALASINDRSEALKDRLRTIFGNLADPVIAEFDKKRLGASPKDEAAFIAGNWEKIKTSVQPFLLKAGDIRETLKRAGAKTHYSQLQVDAESFKNALCLALAIRSRYTVLDLAFALGELEGWAEEIIAG